MGCDQGDQSSPNHVCRNICSELSFSTSPFWSPLVVLAALLTAVQTYLTEALLQLLDLRWLVRIGHKLQSDPVADTADQTKK